MKRFALLVVSTALMSVPMIRADDAPRPTRPQPGDEPRPVRPEGRGNDSPRVVRPEGVRDARGDVRGQTTAAAYIANLDPDVSLTEDQKKAITAIFETRDKSIKEFETQNIEKLKTASKAMEEAYQTRDREAIAKVQQEYRDVFEPIHEVMRKANDDLTALLTDEQKGKLRQKRIEQSIRSFAAPVELTDEQVKKLVGVLAGSENDRRALREKLEPALQEMLTPEQKAAVTRQRTIQQVQASLGTRLNREQQKELNAAYDEASKETGISKEDLVKKLTEKVTALLTDEQKEAIKNRPALRERPENPRPAERGTN